MGHPFIRCPFIAYLRRKLPLKSYELLIFRSNIDSIKHLVKADVKDAFLEKTRRFSDSNPLIPLQIDTYQDKLYPKNLIQSAYKVCSPLIAF